MSSEPLDPHHASAPSAPDTSDARIGGQGGADGPPDSERRSNVPPDSGRRRGGHGRPKPAGYYGIPPIHKPHWQGLITWYFYLGGLSAGSYVVAAVAELFGRPEDRAVVRVGRYLSALIAIPCPILLTLDLGRPERFHLMFRVVKLRSPMSLGTWGLLLFGGFSALSAAIQAGRDGVFGSLTRPIARVPARPVAALGSLLGFFIGGYTGVLLGATAVPLWARNARLLGPLFLSSALSSACALIGLVLACLPGRHEQSAGRLERAELLAAAGEAALLAAIHVHSGPLAAPMTSGRLGRLHAAGSVGAGLVAPLLIRVAGRRLRLPPRLLTILASSLVLLGGYLVKHVVVEAGRASADDPTATFRFARREGTIVAVEAPAAATPDPLGGYVPDAGESPA